MINHQVINYFNDSMKSNIRLAFWDEGIQLTDVHLLFELLKKQIKVDWNNNGVIELQRGDKLFFDYSSKVDEAKIVTYLGTEEKKFELIDGEIIEIQLLKLQARGSSNLDYSLQLQENLWKLRPAEPDQIVTPTTLNINHIPPYVTSSRILANDLEIPEDQINLIKRTNIVLITNQSRLGFIERLREFSYKNYNFLDYFPARYWEGGFYNSISREKYKRGSYGKAIVHIFSTLIEALEWIDKHSDEEHLIFSDKYEQIFKPINLKTLKDRLKKSTNINCIFFGSAQNLRKLITNSKTYPSIYDDYIFESVVTNKGSNSLKELLVGEDFLEYPMSDSIATLEKIAKTTQNSNLQESIKKLIRNLLKISPNVELISLSLEDVECMQMIENIPPDLIKSIREYGSSSNLKFKKFKELIDKQSVVAKVREGQFERVSSPAEAYKNLKEGKNLGGTKFVVLTPYDSDWIVPLLYVGAIGLDQVIILLYKEELEFWRYFIKIYLKALKRLGMVNYIEPEVLNESQEQVSPFWEMFEPSNTRLSTGSAADSIRARILKVSLDSEEYVFAIPVDNPSVFVLSESGSAVKKKIEELDFLDRIIYFSGNRNVLQEFKGLLDSVTKEMSKKSKMWKLHVEKYVEKNGFSRLTRKLNHQGWTISENAVRLWLSPDRIGTMRPYDEFPIIAKAIDDADFEKKADEYAEACTFLQAKSKRFGRWLIKLSRAMISGGDVSDLIKQYPKELQDRLKQIAQNYKIYEFEEIIEGEYDIKASEINHIRRV